ncbi:MAG: hypothetical protein IPM24_22505 [Bryobacterales bacterium]|nr:hypothetical protein [Bryobacterales bacterium]
MMARLAVWLAAGVAAWAAPPLTTIEDTLFKADGTRFNGIVLITWTTFEGPNQTNIATQGRTVRIIDGRLNVQLAPTVGTQPAAYYLVKYNSDGKFQFSEHWTVPSNPAPMRVRDVRVAGPLWPGDSASGQLGEVTIEDVSGLPEELEVRPRRGTGFLPSRAAVINDLGEIDAALGSLADCVRVDGTAAPCGTASVAFFDRETPGGVVDGVNTLFNLLFQPEPPESVRLFRNGLLQTAGVDYSVSGSAITFLPGAAPQPGDVLAAYYRVLAAGAPMPNFADGVSPVGVIDGVNAEFTLPQAPNPASSLMVHRNGVLKLALTDYTINGSTIEFQPGSVPQPGDVLRVSYRH